VTEPTPEPPVEDPPPQDPPPLEEEEEPADPGEEQPAEPSESPCTSVYPHNASIVCELFANHFDFRLPHTSHANDTVYEWE
jgi:hypothetical protein